MEKELLSKSNFYKIGSFAITDIASASSWDIGNAMRAMSQDVLVTQDRLPDYEQSESYIAPRKLYSFNNRVLAIGGERTISDGFAGLQSLCFPTSPNAFSYTFAYYIDGNDGEQHKVVYPSAFLSYQIDKNWAQPYGFMCHPDSRCSKVEIRDNYTGEVYFISMKPHPGLNCSYAYWGLSKTIADLDKREGTTTDTGFASGQNPMEKDSLRIYQSAPYNPFFYPLSGNKTLQGNVIGMAVATTPLSQGQFGQYPLYAFTDEGIFAMQVDAMGNIVSIAPSSRDVCMDATTILPITDAVVFVSNRGVMLVQGNETVSLSPHMNGKHYTINGSSETIIKGQNIYSHLVDSVKDPTPFMSFIKSCTIAYDYAGERLIFINPSVNYQYVYSLKNQTWHKTHYGKNFVRPVNSYPSCELMAIEDGTTKIYNLSTILDESLEKKTERAVIATRPLDLDEPDAYKTVTDVRVRGSFRKGSVKFILQGSDDGIEFYSISTLRGKAWKQFRIILLADLNPEERISWIDIMYDTKFNTRLR